MRFKKSYLPTSMHPHLTYGLGQVSYGVTGKTRYGRSKAAKMSSQALHNQTLPANPNLNSNHLNSSNLNSSMDSSVEPSLNNATMDLNLATAGAGQS